MKKVIILLLCLVLGESIMAKELDEPFSKGEEFKTDVFIGKVYLKMLTDGKDGMDCPIANVTFEPKCRNNWHTHDVGQILLVMDGEGYYQEEGKPVQHLKRGDVVVIPKDVKHWHGATADSWFSHLSITPKGSENKTTWLEPVEDSYYNNLEK